MSNRNSVVKTNGIDNKKSAKGQPTKKGKVIPRPKKNSSKEFDQYRNSGDEESDREDLVKNKSQFSGGGNKNRSSRENVDELADLEIQDDENEDFDEKGVSIEIVIVYFV